MKVYSDKYKKYKEDRDEMMMGGYFSGEIVPVDLYGKRVNLEKDNKSNLEKTAKDINEFYGYE